jgi:hypothetical protein
MNAAITHLDMSISRAEFLRGLNRLANEMESLSQTGESEWELCAASGCVHVRFRERPPRLSGALALPRAEITLDMRALPRERREAFLRRFRLTFQRGGG